MLYHQSDTNNTIMQSVDGRSGDAQVVIGIKVKHSVILTIE
jgi:hypothetical protein